MKNPLVSEGEDNSNGEGMEEGEDGRTIPCSRMVKIRKEGTGDA